MSAIFDYQVTLRLLDALVVSPKSIHKNKQSDMKLLLLAGSKSKQADITEEDTFLLHSEMAASQQLWFSLE